MKKRYWLLALCMCLLLVGCSQGKGNGSSKLTLEPYDLSDKEDRLLAHTGRSLFFFTLDGTLAKDMDLERTIEVYENGKLVSDEPFQFGEEAKKYKHSLNSIGMEISEKEITMLVGHEGTLASLNEKPKSDEEASGSTSLLTEKVELKKNTPVYIYGMAISKDGDEIASLGLDEEKPSGGFINSDRAYVYKITLVDRKPE
ncbi:hypothetical protein [Rossellomorea marisflavi]|uniref:hypothetical protein n=1 Tax=Rossellomorea marisflavi TaxID=189381 RepID=UPI0035195C1F